ncbi:hypothetical protein Y1Q_0018661 [Alligator mississippiensis]|uniref:Uncharacterized protein n=1 Tax=Alligator mississippiensis TaxID=8496 RepID=A0A151NS17_ALLMI|nr:hypothetical protein Y1Q_0018661 [Alligator mississippiensis]
MVSLEQGALLLWCSTPVMCYAPWTDWPTEAQRRKLAMTCWRYPGSHCKKQEQECNSRVRGLSKASGYRGAVTDLQLWSHWSCTSVTGRRTLLLVIAQPQDPSPTYMLLSWLMPESTAAENRTFSDQRTSQGDGYLPQNT